MLDEMQKASNLQEAEKMKAEGNEHFKAKRYQKAAVLYKKATKLNPELHTAHSNLAASFLALDKYSAALDAATRCLELVPDFTKAQYRRGQALLSLERFDEAAEQFHQMLQQEDNADARKHLHRAAKLSVDKHKKEGTEAPEVVIVAAAEWAEIVAQQKVEKQAASEAKEEAKRAEREREREKTRDHCLVGAQYNDDNREKVIQNALVFLTNPAAANFTPEMKLQFLTSKGLTKEDAQEAIARAEIEGPP